MADKVLFDVIFMPHCSIAQTAIELEVYPSPGDYLRLVNGKCYKICKIVHTTLEGELPKILCDCEDCFGIKKIVN